METFNSISNALDIPGFVSLLSALGPKIIAGLLIFGLFWLLSRILKRIVSSVFKRRDLDRDIEELVEQGVGITVIVIGIITGLGTIGINVGALIASLGLVGFAIGFALKDAISNILAGVLILVYRPFKRGDFITIAANKGEVIDIDLRYTMLDSELDTILVPNAFLFSNVVKVTKQNSEKQVETIK